jgi:hypothetical protein
MIPPQGESGWLAGFRAPRLGQKGAIHLRRDHLLEHRLVILGHPDGLPAVQTGSQHIGLEIVTDMHKRFGGALHAAGNCLEDRALAFRALQRA